MCLPVIINAVHFISCNDGKFIYNSVTEACDLLKRVIDNQVDSSLIHGWINDEYHGEGKCNSV